MALTKDEMAKAIAEATGQTKAQVEKTLQGMSDVIGQQLKSGEEVKLLGLVKFHVVEVGERTYPNPQGGDPIVKAAHKAVKVGLLAGGKRLAD